MKLLAIDTATEACSAALFVDGRCTERYALEPRGHAALVLPMVEDLLTTAGVALAELDGLAFGRGPGSFTGLRIAASVVQGLAYGAGLRVVPVSDLAALARRAWREHGASRVWAVIDARMGEVYAAAYEVGVDGLPRLVTAETVGVADAVPRPPDGGAWFLAGTGLVPHGGALAGRMGGPSAGTDPGLLPAAADVAQIAVARFAFDAVAPAAAQPVYLRDRVAEVPR